MAKLVELEYADFIADAGLDEQRALFRMCFPENIDTILESRQHYRWKFHSAKNSPPSFEFVALDKDDKSMVGYYAAIPYRYSFKGEPLISGMVCDVMCHSKVRGQGVFRKLGVHSLAELAKRGVDITTGFPIRRDVFPGHLKAGWKIAFELPMFLKPLKSKSVLKDSKYFRLWPVVDFGLFFFSFLTRGRRPSGGQKLETLPFTGFVDNCSDRYEKFHAKWGSDKTIHLIKDINFLQWRLSAPETSYHVVTLLKGEDIRALAIVRATELKGVPTVAILDLMTTPGDERVASRIFRGIEDFARKQHAQTIAIMTSATWARRYRFMLHGFLKTPFIFKLIVKQLSAKGQAPEIMNEECWHPMWIDSDDL
jgi:hypothetical protein